MFLDRPTTLFRTKEKVTDTLREQVTRPGHVYVPYNAKNTYIYISFFAFHSVNVFKFVRRLRTTFSILLWNTPTSIKTRCVFSTSTSQYPLMLLVINRMYLILEYTVLISDPIALHILTHNLSLSSLLRYLVAFESTHVPTSPPSTELDKCNYFKSFHGHQQLAPPPPSRLYGTVRIQFIVQQHR